MIMAMTEREAKTTPRKPRCEIRDGKGRGESEGGRGRDTKREEELGVHGRIGVHLILAALKWGVVAGVGG